MADDDRQETFDAADPAAIDNANRDDKRKLREDADVLRMVMRTKQGRAFVYRLLERCHIYGSVADLGSSVRASDPLLTYHQAGEENVGKQIMLKVIDASADLYMEMLKEQREEEKRLDEVRRGEQKKREATEPGAPLTPDLVPHLPPPAGYPGGPPLPKKDGKT